MPVTTNAEVETTLSTRVARPVAALVTASFLLFVVSVPVGQAIAEKQKGDDSPLTSLFSRAPTKENLRQFEKDLESTSYAKDYVQPRIQLLLTRYGRVGNKLAVVGQGGWLFYTPGLTYLSGPSFLEPDVIRSREKESRDAELPIAADPRPAIFAFGEMLAARHIKLVLFPMPDKTMLQPMQLHGRAGQSGPVPVARNPGLSRLIEEVRARGIEVFDAAPEQVSPSGEPHFLVQDTHYTPQWMEKLAQDLSRVVEHDAPAAHGGALHAVTENVERVGDLVDMLKLPDDQSYFVPQKVTVHQVQDASGAAWEPDPAGDVLLLGDSFTNVFSMDTMGWGEAAGLAPQLSFALGRSIDVIAQNDSGAFATRLALSRALEGGDDRLEGKHVVVWEFASRELAVGDWRPIDWARALKGLH